jgi:hypothetical protein
MQRVGLVVYFLCPSAAFAYPPCGSTTWDVSMSGDPKADHEAAALHWTWANVAPEHCSYGGSSQWDFGHYALCVKNGGSPPDDPGDADAACAMISARGVTSFDTWVDRASRTFAGRLFACSAGPAVRPRSVRHRSAEQ